MLKDLEDIIARCRELDRSAQEKLYREFYSTAMTICTPYSNSTFEAEEMVNDGFIKAFKSLDNYNPEYPFGAWLRRIMINSAIDHYRSQKKHYFNLELSSARELSGDDLSIFDQLSAEELMEMVRSLSSAYRTCFLLYVVEGYKHHEIAAQLGISEGTSKSNLAKAKKRLQQMILKREKGGNRG